MKKPLIATLLLLLLTGCAAQRELSSDSKGSDKMLKSPCVCTQLDYHGRGFQWLG